jgi:Arc/MetJ-type ribon-helix-helix transcriptional regulator
MTVTLPADLQKKLEAEVAAGRAESVEAVVAAAVRAQLATTEDLRRSLDEAEAEYDAKGGVAWSQVVDHINARLRADD